MNLLLYPDIAMYRDEDYEHDLLLLPPERREKALRFRHLPDRKRSVKAYMLLWDGLREFYGFAPDQCPIFDYGPQGKPVLRDYPDIHFSLSHTINAVACALDDRPVGVDVEAIRPFDERILSRVFSEQEQTRIWEALSPEQMFYVLWTRKESFVKQNGTGITVDLRTVPTEGPFFETIIREDFVCTVCTERF